MLRSLIRFSSFAQRESLDFWLQRRLCSWVHHGSIDTKTQQTSSFHKFAPQFAPEDPLDDPFAAGLMSHKPMDWLWYVFCEQASALEYLKRYRNANAEEGQQDKAGIFAYEPIGWSRGRKFLVTSYANFWHVYAQLNHHQRHVHELIPKDAPCNFYADLEFCREQNPEIHSDAKEELLLEQFMSLVARGLRQNYPSSFSSLVQSDEVVKLTSCRPEKFSFHVIVRLPYGKHFANNLELGKFMRKMWIELESMSVEERCAKGLHLLMVRNGQDELVPVWDPNVYQRNKTLRMFLSSKKSADVPFVLHSRQTGFHSAESVFYRSLICNVSCDDAYALPLLIGEETGYKCGTSSCSRPDNLPSPFPEVDGCIRRFLASNRNLKGSSVGKYCLLPSQPAGAVKYLIYSIEGSRYCNVVGRQHRSNSVYILVDLAKLEFYQKCFDVICRDEGGYEYFKESLLDYGYC